MGDSYYMSCQDTHNFQLDIKISQTNSNTVTVVAFAMTSTVADIVAAGASSTRNGGIVFGFVASADPGLLRNEYVIVPSSSTKINYTLRPHNTADNNFGAHYVECLFTDAAAVDSFAVPDEIKPWIAANRAYSYAAGYLGEESVIATTPLTDVDKQALLAQYPHIAPAAHVQPGPGTLATFVCTTNFYTTNHNTGGSILPKGHVKAIKTAYPPAANLDPKVVTRATYLAGHATDKRITLRFVLPQTISAGLVDPQVYHPAAEARMDSWAATRTNNGLAAAGTSIVGLLKVVLTEVARVGLLGIAPAPQAVLDLKAACTNVAANPHHFHPGARYLFNIDPVHLADVENLKGHMATFGGFCTSAGLANSVVSARHIQDLINERKDAFWFNLGKQFAKGVAANEEVVKAALSACGTVFGANIPNPVNDPAGYKTSVDALAGELSAIDMTYVPTTAAASGALYMVLNVTTGVMMRVVPATPGAFVVPDPTGALAAAHPIIYDLSSGTPTATNAIAASSAAGAP